MYLQRLKEFAENNEDVIGDIGFRDQPVGWIVEVSDGKLNFIKATKEQRMNLPDVGRSKNVEPKLLVDNAGYVFGWDDKKKEIKENEKTTKYIELLKKHEEELEGSYIKELIRILEDKDFKLPEGIKTEDNIVFLSGLDNYEHETIIFKEIWKSHYEEISKKKNKMTCLMCGEEKEILQVHPGIIVLEGEKPKIVSANKTAYMSQGLKDSDNSPICYDCENKYVRAINYLLRDRYVKGTFGGPNCFELDGVYYIYWMRQKEQLTGLGGLINLDIGNEEGIKDVVASVFTGVSMDTRDKDLCMLTVSVNKSRLVVRGYEESNLDGLRKNIENFFKVQDIGTDKKYGINSLVKSLAGKSKVSEQMKVKTEWVGWALHGKKLSRKLLIPMMQEVRKNGELTSVRVAAIKSWLVSQNKKGDEWTVGLNREETKESYLMGRLFAVLEKLQQDATSPNNTLSTRYFKSASTTPSIIFGKLLKDSKVHLGSVGKGAKGREIYYGKRIQDILTKIEEFPKYLTLEEGAEFALGYWHEKQDLYTKKKEEDGE